jgi:hypothetical protein
MTSSHKTFESEKCLAKPKTFEFAKYMHKDLADYNRLVVYFNNKLPQTNSRSEIVSNIILQIKTVFSILDSVDITTNKCYINIYDNYIKKIQKSAYIKQNRVYALHILGESKSNLFGWSDQEDGDVLDKYISQRNIEKYTHSIIDLHEIPMINNVNDELSSVQLCKEYIGITTQCTNLCKDTYICESYVDYKVKLDAVTCFIIREYVDTVCTDIELAVQRNATVGTHRINIMLMCEFNEEMKIFPDKLVKLEKYINAVNYIIANV